MGRYTHSDFPSNFYKRCMTGYFDLRGRSPRFDYWMFTLVLTAIYSVAGILGNIPDPPALLTIIVALVLLAHIVPMLTVGIRRLHDTDRSGWMMLISLIPFVGLIMIFFFAQAGTEGPNNYGPDPYGDDGLIRGPAKFTTRVPATRAGFAPPASSRDALAEIERLAKLRSQGVLSETEFNVLKAKVMNASA